MRSAILFAFVFMMVRHVAGGQPVQAIIEIGPGAGALCGGGNDHHPDEKYPCSAHTEYSIDCTRRGSGQASTAVAVAADAEARNGTLNQCTLSITGALRK